MNKLIFTLAITIAFSTLTSGQIKVTPGGDFTVGQNYSTNNWFKTEINGERKIALGLTTRHEEGWSWASISDATHPTTKHWIVSDNAYSNHHFFVTTLGDVYGRAWWTLSDETIKENIEDIENASELILALQPKYYTFKSGYQSIEDTNTNLITQEIGLLAQDVQEVLPQLVQKEDSLGLLRINYQGIIPLLVQHAKNQEQRIKYLEDALVQCCATSSPQLTANNKQKNSTNNYNEVEILSVEDGQATEMKVIPNPNKGSFDVEFSAKIEKVLITDLTGKFVENVNILDYNTTKVHVSFLGNRPGVFMLHIVNNGTIVASQKVVILN